MRLKLNNLCFAFVIVLLAGCSIVGSQHGSQVDFTDTGQWTMRAKLSVRQNTDIHTLNTYWQQNSEQYEIQLFGLFGAGRTTLSSHQQGVAITQGSDTQLYPSARQALAANTGLSLPIEGLPYWLRGLPSPQASATQAENPEGQISQLQQMGWKITYSAYFESGLPRKMQISRDTIFIKIIVKQWQ